MKKRFPKIAVVAAVLILAGLALPVSNLLVGLPKNNSLAGVQTDDVLFAGAAAVLGAKCVNCHTTEYTLPFYANFPIARPIIEKDIHDGIRYMDMLEALFPAPGEPVSEVVLAKNEYTVEYNTMPPGRYLALHWNGGLTAAERAAILDWVKSVRRKHYATPDFPEHVQENVVQPIPLTYDLDERKVAMGDKVFHDTRLSKDNSISCASCHDIDKGGTDQLDFSEGVGGAVGDINAPTVFNSGFQFMQFWDGRAADLEEQADGPVNNPIEMASNWPEAIGKLQQDERFMTAFTALYPEGPTKDTLIDAIATYERSLITPDSRFDKYLAGDSSALTAEELAGYKHFLDFACATCHVGKLMGGQSFEPMGLKADYFGDRGEVIERDYGRFNHTKDEKDRFRFKVPTLRNIAVTFPYLHDASAKTLEEAVEVMSKYQVNGTLSKTQVAQVVAFLHTLTGEYRGRLLE